MWVWRVGGRGPRARQPGERQTAFLRVIKAEKGVCSKSINALSRTSAAARRGGAGERAETCRAPAAPHFLGSGHAAWARPAAAGLTQAAAGTQRQGIMDASPPCDRPLPRPIALGGGTKQRRATADDEARPPQIMKRRLGMQQAAHTRWPQPLRCVLSWQVATHPPGSPPLAPRAAHPPAGGCPVRTEASHRAQATHMLGC